MLYVTGLKNNIIHTKKTCPSDNKKAETPYFKSVNLALNPSGYYNKLAVSFKGGDSVASKDGLNIRIQNIKAPEGFSKQNNTKDKYIACIMGGAIGDALGAPVEFMELDRIKRLYGEEGVTELTAGESGEAEFTDDTQMTFFTADGLIKDVGKYFNPNKIPDMRTIYNSYLNWFATQNTQYRHYRENDGWIINLAGLYEQKDPGNTCLRALASGKMGTIHHPINKSKGNGGIMRIAPVGLLYHNNPEVAFETASRCAAITHGHPSGYLSAGAFAAILANVINGEDLNFALDAAEKILKTKEGHQETLNAIKKARMFADDDTLSEEEAVDMLGRGWTGEQALSIAIYCALKHPDSFEDALKLSVNHSGDSDSTGAICGNLMGAYLGINSIPLKWKNKIQYKAALRQLACDLYNTPHSDKDLRRRYPYNHGRTPNWYSKRVSVPSTPRRLEYVTFPPEEEEKMKEMSPVERMEYKKNLIRSGQYKN